MNDLDSLYDEYLKEKDGIKIIRNDYGFISYKIKGTECFVYDVFVKKECRRQSKFSKLFDEVCKIATSEKCAVVSGTIFLSNANFNSSLLAMLKVGAEVKAANPGVLLLAKKIRSE